MRTMIEFTIILIVCWLYLVGFLKFIGSVTKRQYVTNFLLLLIAPISFPIYYALCELKRFGDLPYDE